MTTGPGLGLPAGVISSSKIGPAIIQRWEGPEYVIRTEGTIRFTFPAETGLPVELGPPQAGR